MYHQHKLPAIIFLHEFFSHGCEFDEILSIGLIFHQLLSHTLFHYSFAPPPMRGKRARTVSSSPTYERVIWVERKTARGAKITAKVSNSPKTPRTKKWAAPLNRRKTDFLSLTPAGPSTMTDNPPTPPAPIALKKQSKKVGSYIPIIGISNNSNLDTDCI